ncbi:MAG: BtpA/SgcQ family protein [Bacteriovoracaceae bacterium]
MKQFTIFFFLCALALQAFAADPGFISPREKLKKITTRQKSLWIVVDLAEDLKETIKDADAALDNGADAVIFEGRDFAKSDKALGELRKHYPKAVLGMNLLGPDENLHTYKETFDLVRKHNLQIAWTDFSGVDLIKEAKEVSLHDIQANKPVNAFYISGIHMKYSTLLDSQKPIELSALQAMGWVDGIVITGPRTGVATDPDRARRVRKTIGDYPMGAASGVSAENVKSILENVDFVIVNTSVSNGKRRIVGEKVRTLRKPMDGLN